MGAQYYEKVSFFSFFREQDGKKFILTYVAVFMGARSLIYEKFLLCDRVPLRDFEHVSKFLKAVLWAF